MNLPEDHMSFEKCIDIFESELGDHEPREPYAGVHISQAMRIAIELLKREIEPAKWIRYVDQNADQRCTCSNCNTDVTIFREHEAAGGRVFQYCPFCGKRMVKD